MGKKKKYKHKVISNKNTSKLNVWQISTAVLGLLLIFTLVGNFTNTGSTGISGQSGVELSSQAVSDKAIIFINEYLMQGAGVATVTNIEDNGDLYSLTLNVDGEEFESYVTKDGSLLFPSAISLEETPEIPQQQQGGQAAPANLQKSDKPEVELFVMSHCPYGTQMEKGIIPVVRELGDKISFEIKFVNYAMHPTQGEVEEQLNQYCIQRDYNDKYLDYLSKFLESGDGEEALSSVGLSQADISQCVEETDDEFNVIQNLEDESSWSSGRFPKFMIHNEDNINYGVRGSPTLIINGQQAESGRDAQSILNTICSAFTETPEECNTDMTSFGTPAPGFGFGTQGGSASAAGCGV